LTAREPFENKRLSDRAFGGLLWQFAGKGSRGLLQVGVLAVLARLVTPADFGIVGAALIIIGVSSILSQLGVGPALVHRPELNRSHIRTAFTIAVSSSIVIAAAVWFSASSVSRFFDMPELEYVLLVLSGVFVLRGLGITAESLLQREFAFQSLAVIEVVSYGFGYGVIVTVFGFLGYGYWALVAGHIGQSIIRTLGMWKARSHPAIPQFKRRAARELLVYGTGQTLGKGFNYVALQGDNLVIGRWLGADALGIYGRVYSLLVTPATLFGQVIDRVLFPSLAEIQDDVERRTAGYRRAIVAVGILALPASAFMLTTAREIVLVLLGGQWTEVVVPLQILCIGLLFRTSYKLSDALALATGAVYRRAWRQAVYAGVVLGGSLLGVAWGVPGVSVGILVAIGINYFMMAGLSIRLTSLSWRDFGRAHLPGLRLACVLGITAVAVTGVMRRVVDWPVLTLIIVTMTSLMTIRGMWHLWPQTFLGRDGRWALSLAERNLPNSVLRLIVPGCLRSD